MKGFRLFLPILVLAAAFFATACEKVTISKLTNNTSRYLNKQVGIVGRVEDSYGVPMLGGAYKVNDGTGSIWVVSRGNSTPTRGTQIGVKGRLQDGISFNGRNYGLVLMEEDRRVR